jgi:hypothetical protein
MATARYVSGAGRFAIFLTGCGRKRGQWRLPATDSSSGMREKKLMPEMLPGLFPPIFQIFS